MKGQVYSSTGVPKISRRKCRGWEKIKAGMGGLERIVTRIIIVQPG